jgi:hypothetical protein
MFLMSDAFRRRRPWRHCEWGASTVLCVAHDWDPERNTAESLASRRLVSALLDAGARVHVLTSARPGRELQHDRLGVTVVPPRGFPSNRAHRAIRMIRTSIPEAEGAWVPAAAAAGIALARSFTGDTLIYSRANPGVSNIAAWHIARGVQAPWVAHFSDEWPARHVLSNGRRWLAPYKAPLFQLWRQRIVRDAGALTFTNPFQAEEVVGAGARHRGKVFVVPHLSSQHSRRERPPQYDLFHLVHTGNFYPNQHTSAALIQGLARFLARTPSARACTRFTQAGWANGDLQEWTARCALGDVVHLAGRLDQPGVIELVDSGTVLIAVDYARPDSRTVLSKIPDYIDARRPMLAITAPASALSRLFCDDGAGLTADYRSPEEVADRIATLFEAWRARRLAPWLPKPAAIESFTPARALAELGAAFEVARASHAVAPRASRPAFEWRQRQDGLQP